MTRQDFVTGALAAAGVVAVEGGPIVPWVTAAQACLESRYGESKLAYQAHNYFGVKAGKHWTGNTILLPTKEFVNGKVVTVIVRWCVFNSMIDCFRDYAARIALLSWYADAARAARLNDGMGFLRGLTANGKEPGWATDPKYEFKVLEVARAWNLIP